MNFKEASKTDGPVVFVVDDDLEMRESLQWLIETTDWRVETHASARDFLDKYDPDCPGCVLLDNRMPGMTGLELQQHLRDQKIDIPIIVITAYGDVPTAVRAMKSGALDFIEKPIHDHQLLELIERAISHDSKIRDARLHLSALQERVALLTQREDEVMKLVVDGLSSKEIAGKIGVSFKTVEAHRAKIMKKMQAKSVPHLIRMNLRSRIDQ